MRGVKDTRESLIKRFQDIHGDRYDYSLVDNTNYREKVCVICNVCGNQWFIHSHSHLAGFGCKKCALKYTAAKKTVSLEEFLKRQKAIHGDNYIYISDYINISNKVKLQCKRCSNIFIQVASAHIRGEGCRKCSSKISGLNKRKTVEQFEIECSERHNHKYQYFQDYTCSRNKVKIFCKNCQNIFYQEANHHFDGFGGCPRCSISLGNTFVLNWLKTNKILYEVEKTFEGCKYKKLLRFDFYIPSHNLCIEYDGQQHFESIDYFGGDEHFEYCKNNDKIKNEYCVNHSIRLLRISYKDYKNIGKILSKEILNMEEESCQDPSLISLQDSANSLELCML